jgi:hypothetical protein
MNTNQSGKQETGNLDPQSRDEIAREMMRHDPLLSYEEALVIIERSAIHIYPRAPRAHPCSSVSIRG